MILQFGLQSLRFMQKKPLSLCIGAFDTNSEYVAQFIRIFFLFCIRSSERPQEQTQGQLVRSCHALILYCLQNIKRAPERSRTKLKVFPTAETFYW